MKRITQDEMEMVYENLRTPYKFGMVVTGTGDEGTVDVDCPCVFRYEGKWYMVYVSYDAAAGIGYRTHLASSEDLLHWRYVGCVFERGNGLAQCAAFPSLIDPEWGNGSLTERYDGRYWLTTMEGAVTGYEGEPMNIGQMSSADPVKISEYRHEEGLILSVSDSGVRPGERGTLYRSHVIHDRERLSGHEFVMYYNAKDSNPNTERIFMAVSDDMRHWRRAGNSHILWKEGFQITGDPQVVKMGDLWVLNFFAYAGGNAHAYDTFAVSHNLTDWTIWDGEPLTDSGAEYDSRHAHKPWVIEWEGVVYHFYCARAVDGRPRGIALAVSSREV